MRPTCRIGSRLTRAACGVSLVLLLGACENVKDQLGLNKSSPDEFSVLTRAPPQPAAASARLKAGQW